MRSTRVTTHDGQPYGIRWHCPGCNDEHVVPTHGEKAWGFNGDFERPTLTPSVLVHPSQRWSENGPVPTPRCHCFVRDGRIEFLGDCTHALAGHTVNLPEIEP